MNQFISYVNNTIERESRSLKFIVKDQAPSTMLDLVNQGPNQLIVWSGASESTIYQDASVNYMFRALHDHLHLQTTLDFSVEAEIEIGRIQANIYARQCKSLFADLVYLETTGQATYYKNNGIFIADQVEWTLKQLKG